jgi:hypothetical protein
MLFAEGTPPLNAFTLAILVDLQKYSTCAHVFSCTAFDGFHRSLCKDVVLLPALRATAGESPNAVVQWISICFSHRQNTGSYRIVRERIFLDLARWIFGGMVEFEPKVIEVAVG